MTTYTVLGPHGYSRPPYGSFANKPLFVPQRTYTQTFTVLGPHAYSRPPYGSFAAKTTAVITAKVAGWISGKPTKRWWEELQEEYQAQYAREDKLRASKSKQAVVARKEAKRIAEYLYEGGLLTPELAQKAVAIQYVPRVDETLRILAEIRRIREQLIYEFEQDEEETLLLLM